jgi:predicted RNA binding protein YcfA (HicA-like mRNA interferase family)
MVKGDLTLTVPNPHQKDIGREFLNRILRQAGISREVWERL